MTWKIEKNFIRRCATTNELCTHLNYICKSRAKHKKNLRISSEIKKNNNLCDIFLRQEKNSNMFKRAFLHAMCKLYTPFNSYFWDFRSFFGNPRRARHPATVAQAGSRYYVLFSNYQHNPSSHTFQFCDTAFSAPYLVSPRRVQ